MSLSPADITRGGPNPATAFLTLDGSGGGDPSGGNDTSGGSEPPQIRYDGTPVEGPLFKTEDIIGDRATVSVKAPAGKTIDTVHWTLPPGAVKGQNPPKPGDGGFVNIGFQPGDQALDASSLTFYWINSGDGDITANVSYNEGGNDSATIHVTLVMPELSVQTNYALEVGIKNVTKDGTTLPALYYDDPRRLNAAGDITPINVINDYGHGGSAKTVQVMTDATDERNTFVHVPDKDNPIFEPRRYWRYAEVLTNGTVLTPRPILDDGAGELVFYEDSALIPGADKSPTLRLDTSDLGWSYPLFESVTSYRMMRYFTDTVMYKPSNGIWVPTGLWSWTINATADPSTDPATVTNLINPREAHTEYASSFGTGWPTWERYSASFTTWILTG